jgi:hypothetical protein
MKPWDGDMSPAGRPAIYPALVLKALRSNGGEIYGVFELAHHWLGMVNVYWLRMILREQLKANQIEIVDQGPGKPKIIRLKGHS